MVEARRESRGEFGGCELKEALRWWEWRVESGGVERRVGGGDIISGAEYY